MAVNEAWSRNTGYSEAETLGKTPAQLDLYTDPETGPEIRRALQDPGCLYNTQITFRLRNGKLVPCRASMVSLEWGGTTCALSVFQEISAQVAMERELAATATKFRTVWEASRDAVGVARAGLIEYVNPAHLELFGYSDVKQIEGRSLLDLVAPACRADMVERVRHRESGEDMPTIYETRGLRQDGSEFDMEIHVSRYELGGTWYTMGLMRDITGRRLEAQALRESEARFRALYDGTPVAIAVGRQGVNLHANPAFVNLFGFDSLQQTIGRPIGEFWAEESRLEIQDRNLRRSRGEAVLSEYEGLALRRDGTTFPAQIAATTIALPDGPATAAFITDISARKRAEAEMRERLKEATCRAEIRRLLASDLALEELATNAVKALVPAMQFPDDAVAMLDLNGTRYCWPPETGNAAESVQATVHAFGQEHGSLRVAYTRLHGFLLPYEQDLVDGIAQEIGLWLERRLALSGLSASEERYRQIVETAREGILACDATLRITYANPRCTEILGYSRDELLRLKLDDFITKEDLPNFAARKAAVMQGQTSLYEGEFVAKDSRPVWLLNSASPVMVNGIFTGVVLMVTDVTDRRQAEDAMRISEARYRSLVENQNDVIARSDLQGNLTYVNAAYCREFGKTSDQLLGRTFTPTVHPADLPIASEALRVVQHPPYRLHTETRHITPRGLRWFSWQNSAVLDQAGDVVELQGVGRDVTEAKENEYRIWEQLQQFRALREIDAAIASTFGLDLSLGTILTHAMAQLKVDATGILLHDEALNQLRFAAGRGFRTRLFSGERPILLGESYAGRALMDRAPVVLSNISEAADFPLFLEAARAEGFVMYVGVPLLAKGRAIGVLEVFSRSERELSETWHDFLQALAGQAAIAIDNVALFERLQRSNTELALAYEATIEGWSRAMDLRDRETEGHTQRVTELTLKLAQQLGVPNALLADIRHGCLLHDIGKMGVPDAILHKPGPLSPEDWILMKRHPAMALEMLSSLRFMQRAVAIPHCHHENWDGSGYPRGLRGEQIPLEARIFSVVDVWDALTSDRPYRKAWSREETLAYIEKRSGIQFDPHVARAFLDSGLV